MTDTAKELWLIVQPAAAADERLTSLLPGLSGLGFDAYTARQRLVGHGTALLARGKRSLLEKAATLLHAHRFAHWLIAPTTPGWVPERIFALRVSEEAISFTCRNAEVAFPRGSRILAILADLSGKMPEKQLQRLLAQNAYRGVDYLSLGGEEEIYREILRGEPILDLYRLSAAGEAQQGVRLYPGRFDPKGLGALATYSAAGNLEAALTLVKGQAGRFSLHTDFGLASLPDCRPRRPEPGVDHRRESLAALTRFGWLMVDLARARDRHQGDGQAEEALAATLPTTLLSPLLATEPLAPAQPALAAVAAAGGLGLPLPEEEGVAGEEVSPAPPPTRPIGLPAPPETTREGGTRRDLAAWLTGALGTAVALLLAGGWDLLSFVWHRGVRTGMLPAVLSAAFFLAGAQALRWKRRIENTPTSRVRSLAMGMVEVHGRAVRQYALVSPMTHLACVWYCLRRYRRDRHGWRVSSTRSSGAVPFLLDDGTGRVRIDPRRATVRARHREEGYGGGGGLYFTGLGGSSDEKWVEEVIAEGTPLYVLGFARSRRPSGSLAERTREKLRRLKGDRQALGRFDADGDGRISPEEWETARSSMEQAALREQLAETAPRRQEEQAVIGPPPGRLLPFIIAETESEAHLSGRYGRAAAVLLTVGLLCAAWAAAVLLPRYLF